MHTFTQTFSCPAFAKSFAFNLGVSIMRGPKYMEVKTNFTPVLKGCTVEVRDLTDRGLLKAAIECKKTRKAERRAAKQA